MTAPTDRTGDVARVAALRVELEQWNDAGVRAELELALEEDLVTTARGAGLELREARFPHVTYLKRHEWTDEASGQPRLWDEQTTPGQATHVLARLEATAYRPG